jgi:hypothetical protein
MKRRLIILLLLLLFIPGCIYYTGQMPNLGFTPKISLFEATPSVIDQGEVSYLRWSVSDAQSIIIDNGIGDVSSTGTIPVTPASTTFYTLTARNAMGETSARTQIVVNIDTPSTPVIPVTTPPTIVAFLSNRSNVQSGGQVVLTWEVLRAQNITITPVGKVSAKNSLVVTPTTTTTYTLIATNSAGQSMASITISVTPASTPITPGENVIVLQALLAESGSLIKGGGYLDYTRRESACAGDTDINLASRAFLSFDISAIPQNATIKEALLDLSQYTVKGDPSYMHSMWGNMGALEIYYVQYGTYDNLDKKAYTDTGKLVINGKLTSPPDYPWDVKESEHGVHILQSLVNSGETRCQFRLQFFSSTNWDSTSDMLCFDNATLTIRYSTP